MQVTKVYQSLELINQVLKNRENGKLKQWLVWNGKELEKKDRIEYTKQWSRIDRIKHFFGYGEAGFYTLQKGIKKLAKKDLRQQPLFNSFSKKDIFNPVMNQEVFEFYTEHYRPVFEAKQKVIRHIDDVFLKTKFHVTLFFFSVASNMIISKIPKSFKIVRKRGFKEGLSFFIFGKRRKYESSFEPAEVFYSNAKIENARLAEKDGTVIRLSFGGRSLMEISFLNPKNSRKIHGMGLFVQENALYVFPRPYGHLIDPRMSAMASHIADSLKISLDINFKPQVISSKISTPKGEVPILDSEKTALFEALIEKPIFSSLKKNLVPLSILREAAFHALNAETSHYRCEFSEEI